MTDSRPPHLIALNRSLFCADTVDQTVEAKVVELYATLHLPVYRYLVAAFGLAKDAEDVTQETFLQLFRALRSGQKIEHPRPWVFRVAHNLALNGIGHDRFVTGLDDEAWQTLCAVAEDPAPNPEQYLLGHERLRLLERGMRQLSRQQRQCLLLRIEGLRYREIGDVLNVTTSTVAECLRRGIRKLTRALHE